MNDLPNGLKCRAKLFVDDTFIFSVVKDKNDSGKDLINNPSLISKWGFKSKILFNSDPAKPAQKVIFSRKKELFIIYFLYYILVERASCQKHLWIYLDEKLNFKKYIQNILCKVSNRISVKLKHMLPKKSLLSIYTAF